MMLAAIFQDLEHLNDSLTIGYSNVFQNQTKLFHSQNICLPGLPIGCFLHSEAVGPISRDISANFSVLTPSGFEVGVKGQIEYLEKIPRP